jgi:hypothetical protein
MLRVGSSVHILDVEVVLAEVFRHPVIEGVVDLRLNGVVDVAPPDLVLRGLFADDEFVLWAPSGIWDGVDDQWALVCEDALAAAERVFYEYRSSEIPIDLGFRIDAVHG